MPQMRNYYDPEEIRRRNIFTPEMTSDPVQMPSSPLDPVTASIMAPDEGDTEEADDSVTSKPVTLTDAQKQYRSTIEAMPERSSYKPSKWRRFGAALAGGLTGIKNPELGIKVAEGTLNAPYNEAQQDWASRVNRFALSAGIDKEAAAQEIARQRAAAYATSAQARSRIADRQIKHLEVEEARPRKREPQTWQELIELEKIQHPERDPTLFEQYLSDPEGFNKYQIALKAGTVQRLTFEQEKQLQDAANASRERSARISANGKPEKMPFVDAEEQAKTEQLAATEVARQKPEFSKFVEWGDPSDKTKPFRIKRAEEFTSPQDKINYKTFITKLGDAKRRALGVRRTPDGSSGGRSWGDVKEE